MLAASWWDLAASFDFSGVCVLSRKPTCFQKPQPPPPLTPPLSLGQIGGKLLEALGKLSEALRKTYGLLKLRGSGREGQGDGEGRGARGDEHERSGGCHFPALVAGNLLGAKYFNSTITLQ